MADPRLLDALQLVIIAGVTLLETCGATKINAKSVKRASAVGSGYRTEQQLSVGECVSGQTTSAGISNSDFSLSQSLSQAESNAQLGVSVGGRARSGVVDVSFSASFLKNSALSAYTTSAVWMSSYGMPAERFKGIPALTSVGTAVKANDERWAQNLRQRICRGGYKRRTLISLDKIKIYFDRGKEEVR